MVSQRVHLILDTTAYRTTPGGTETPADPCFQCRARPAVGRRANNTVIVAGASRVGAVALRVPVVLSR
ncbi:hypothetical protein GCM10023223_40470 [Stackebrandtia albiflava]